MCVKRDIIKRIELQTHKHRKIVREEKHWLLDEPLEKNRKVLVVVAFFK